MRARLLLILGVACGGRTELFVENDSTDAAVDSGVPTQDASPIQTCQIDGVRICGPGCPPLGTPDCCTAVHDRDSGAPLQAGVCWTDLADFGQRTCAGCKDGEVCVQRANDRLVCVPFDLCRALDGMGMRQACRYADKSAYDGRPLANPPTSCPIKAAEYRLCGGACGNCGGGPVPWCTGRSADRAFGTCINSDMQYATSPDGSRRCATIADCRPNSTTNPICVVDHVNAADQSTADRYGYCSYSMLCTVSSMFTPLFCR